MSWPRLCLAVITMVSLCTSVQAAAFGKHCECETDCEHEAEYEMKKCLPAPCSIPDVTLPIEKYCIPWLDLSKGCPPRYLTCKPPPPKCPPTKCDEPFRRRPAPPKSERPVRPPPCSPEHSDEPTCCGVNHLSDGDQALQR